MSRTDNPREYERQDLVVEANEPALALAHDPRLEAAVAVPWRVDRDLAVLGDQRLRRGPVALVCGTAERLLMRLVADVIGQLDLHRPLHQPLRQLRPTAHRARRSPPQCSPQRAARRSPHR